MGLNVILDISFALGLVSFVSRSYFRGQRLFLDKVLRLPGGHEGFEHGAISQM